MLPNRADVVIVGGGITGCSIAYHLTRRGRNDVAVFEASGLASGATGVCPGGIRQQFAGEADCRWARHSLRFWRDINDELAPSEPFHFERCGYLMVAHSDELMGSYERYVHAQNRLGVPSRVVTPAEIHELVPDLKIDDVAGGTFCAEDGFLEDCPGVTFEFARHARQRGARFYFEQVTGIQRGKHEWNVRCGSGSLSCRHVVLAAGLGCVALAAQLGVALPITEHRRRLAITTPVESRVLHPLLVAPERGFAGRQRGSGEIFCGWLPEQGHEDDLLFTERTLAAGATLLQRFNDLPIRTLVRGSYDSTPDHRPILGPIRDHRGLWIAAGFSGHGFMLAPAVGDAIACLIDGGLFSLSLQPFALDRFDASCGQEELFI